ncbi:uncharacterized protein LOC111373944 [Olea europaea var. sylvestris]|uniref:uncharacterized protein LOC111373944 n=1 Tax=Olea europaea var. sylvestris TaxID=158386 RepID=UPI000C1CE8E9|nr:uncharacterized protein LOC111373944 [Olea europaea var. sylvestris]
MGYLEVLGLIWKFLWGKLGTKLLFSTISHPQADGQIEVVNRTLTQLLRAIIYKNSKSWEDCLPFMEFAYSRTLHSITSCSSFAIAFHFNLLTPLKLIPLHVDERGSVDGKKKVELLRSIHKKVRLQIEKKDEHYASQANKGRMRVKVRDRIILKREEMMRIMEDKIARIYYIL